MKIVVLEDWNHFFPGRPSLELAKGKSGKIGSMEVRFVNFDLQVEGNAMAQMAAGKPVTIGADLEVTRNGVMQPVKALYRMTCRLLNRGWRVRRPAHCDYLRRADEP